MARGVAADAPVPARLLAREDADGRGRRQARRAVGDLQQVADLRARGDDEVARDLRGRRRPVSPGPERATRGASTARRGFEFGTVRDRALGQPVLAAVAGRGAVGHAHDLRSMRYVRWRRRRRRRRRGRLRGGRRPGTTMRCVTRGLAASAAAVAPASTERPSMGVYELARAAASRCAARIEELPVFRLAWSERGAPRRAARWLVQVGASGAPGVYMGRRLAGAADAISRTPTRNAPEAAALRGALGPDGAR